MIGPHLLRLAITLAQTQPPAPASPPPAPSPAELAEIERALSADQSGQKTAPPAPDASATSGLTVASSMNPDFSFVADMAAAAFSTDEPLQSGGHDPQKNGVQPAAAGDVGGARRSIPISASTPTSCSASSGWRSRRPTPRRSALPANLQLRAGQFLTRFGRTQRHPPSRLGLRRSADRHRAAVRRRGQPRAGPRAVLAWRRCPGTSSWSAR